MTGTRRPDESFPRLDHRVCEERRVLTSSSQGSAAPPRSQPHLTPYPRLSSLDKLSISLLYRTKGSIAALAFGGGSNGHCIDKRRRGSTPATAKPQPKQKPTSSKKKRKYTRVSNTNPNVPASAPNTDSPVVAVLPPGDHVSIDRRMDANPPSSTERRSGERELGIAW